MAMNHDEARNKRILVPVPVNQLPGLFEKKEGNIVRLFQSFE